jgi:hypothetical protein
VKTGFKFEAAVSEKLVGVTHGWKMQIGDLIEEACSCSF